VQREVSIQAERTYNIRLDFVRKYFDDIEGVDVLFSFVLLFICLLQNCDVAICVAHNNVVPINADRGRQILHPVGNWLGLKLLLGFVILVHQEIDLRR
jgi:hypothetical protein